MGYLVVIAIFFIIVKIALEENEMQMPSGMDGNKLAEDARKVSFGEMSRREYRKKIKSGHYHK